METTFPRLDARHVHTRQLLENAARYFQPENGMIDPVSGYPREGWNQEPERGLYLRDFTQLTAIGLWIEWLGACVAGDVLDPHWTTDRSLEALDRVRASLEHDQQDPRLADRGLLGNFLALGPDGRSGPMASEVHRRDFDTALGADRAGRVWIALKEKGWIRPMRDQQMAVVRRPPGYGLGGFDGPLAPFAEIDTKSAILGVLDQRVAQVVFGDNANLASSIAKMIGALEGSALKADTRVRALIAGFERIIERQREGYRFLYDADAKLFRFGWNATLRHFLGWPDGNGDWRVAYSDYLVNEFRGPTHFVVAHYDLPVDGLGQLGFRTRFANGSDGEAVACLAPFDGSAFQSFGLSLCMGERAHPTWHALLDRAAEIHLAYARTHALPGLLSESYSGEGTEYTARCGIPELAVASDGRITHAPSLYTLGIAYALRPEEVEGLLAETWSRVRTLLTPHGPWEGYDTRARTPIRFQTTAHTAALLLGALDAGDRWMQTFLEGREGRSRAVALMPSGEPMNLLGASVRASLWSPHGQEIRGAFEGAGYRIRGTRSGPAHLTLTYPRRAGGVDASGLELRMTYTLNGPIRRGEWLLRSAGSSGRAFPTALEVPLRQTLREPEEVRILLPATPGLQGLQSLELRLEGGAPGLLDFRLESLELRRSEN